MWNTYRERLRFSWQVPHKTPLNIEHIVHWYPCMFHQKVCWDSANILSWRLTVVKWTVRINDIARRISVIDIGDAWLSVHSNKRFSYVGKQLRVTITFTFVSLPEGSHPTGQPQLMNWSFRWHMESIALPQGALAIISEPCREKHWMCPLY